MAEKLLRELTRDMAIMNNLLSLAAELVQHMTELHNRSNAADEATGDPAYEMAMASLVETSRKLAADVEDLRIAIFCGRPALPLR